MKQTTSILFFFFFLNGVFAQFTPDEKVVYKSVDGINLSLHFFFPDNHQENNKTTAIIFFHGGGWRGGGVSHFYNQSAYFASRGLIAINVQYRVEKQHGTTPKECVKDAKSAIRWIRKNASKYGVDKDNIICSGGSAGGHVAAALASLEGFNEEGEDLTVNSIPQALVLFNPVANNSKEGYGYERVREYWKEFSPYHNLKKGTPPTLIMLGTKDKLFPISLAKEYKQKMESLGDRCDLILYEGEDHAFFNIDKNKEAHFQTMYDADIFLASLGYLKGKPTVDKFRTQYFPVEAKEKSNKEN